MPQMSNSQARVIDPILSAVAQGFNHNAYVGAALFPVVPVDSSGGKIITFGKESFMLYNTGRSPGQDTKTVQFGYAGANYALEQHALTGVLPMETQREAAAVPGIDMATYTIRQTQNIIAMRLEKARADLSRTAANYGTNTITLTGTDQWSDFVAAGSDPGDDVEVAKEAIRSKTGKRPNTMVIGAAVYSKLRRHPKILDFFKFSGSSGQLVTGAMLSQYFEVENVQVGDAAFSDDNGNFSDIWGKDAILAYTEVNSLANMGAPTFGYTYQLRDYPVAEEPYYQRSNKSWMFPVTDEVAPVIAGASAGYLIRNCVA